MTYRLIVVLAVLSILTTGCDQITQLENQSNRINNLTKENQHLDEEITDLRTEIKNNKNTIRILEAIKANANDSAFLTPGDNGYSIISYDLGDLTVAIKNIKSYANGSKVWITFGNVSSATILGLKATIQWGKIDKKGFPQFTNEDKRNIELNKPIPGATWVTQSFVLGGVPPNEFGFINISNVHHKGIRLLGKK